MKRFAYVSSSTAITTFPNPGHVFSVTAESWNDEAADVAWKTDAVEENAFVLYAASKAGPERAAWRWAETTDCVFCMLE